ncbi:MAG: GIY-YIG nuclease family protein [bacterium]|nr:GIY-YIG nuclease family protein [bacterium]
MTYTYILKSEYYDQYYFGHTNNLKKRLSEHNSGKSKHTSNYKPWTIVWYACFIEETTAIAFEKYLKTASGKAFLRKRLI